jgi:signal transduction histidine kinase
MNTLKNLIRSVKELPAKYPAVISGYIIYLYLFIVMIRFFIVAKTSVISFYDIVEMFDALPFMWLLAMMLVKVIAIKTKLLESETQRMMKEQELHIKETQINTMREVVMGLQHQINNPLAVILLRIHKVKKSLLLSPEMVAHIDAIGDESKRISQALKDFSATQNYEAELIGKNIGSMALPEKAV